MKIFQGGAVKILWFWSSKLVRNKFWEIQLSWIPGLEKEIEAHISFWDNFCFSINFLGIFKFLITNTKKQDHAGFCFNLKFLGLDFEAMRIDNRHWDYDNDCWLTYPGDDKTSDNEQTTP